LNFLYIFLKDLPQQQGYFLPYGFRYSLSLALGDLTSRLVFRKIREDYGTIFYHLYIFDLLKLIIFYRSEELYIFIYFDEKKSNRTQKKENNNILLKIKSFI
jgi:hypothetical protein